MQKESMLFFSFPSGSNFGDVCIINANTFVAMKIKHYFCTRNANDDKMRIKSLLGHSYWVIEVLLLLLITAAIVSIGLKGHDDAEMIDLLSNHFAASLWLWFISLPIYMIVLLSFIRSLIPPLSIRKKVVLSLHILNVVLLVLFYISLPKPEPCDAALMEKHFKIHHDDMYDLVKYVRSSLDDSCSIILQYRNDEVQKFTIANKNEDRDCASIENSQELETILQTVGLSMKELAVIHEKMNNVGIIGVEIDKNPNDGWKDCKSVLQYRWHGVNIYQFALYDRPMTEQEKHDALSSNQFILYNDSVVFESYGGYPGQRGFPDKEEFLSRHVVK